MKFTHGSVNGTSTLQNCNSVTTRARFNVHHVDLFIPWDSVTTCTSIAPGASISFNNYLGENTYANAGAWQYC